MRIALDTNFLVYAEDVNDEARRDIAQRVLRRLSRADTFVPVQVLGELFSVLTRKVRRPPDIARAAVLGWSDAFTPIETANETLISATDLAVDHQFPIWDAVILASAATADCRLLLSEDMHNGFTWRGVTVVNPFIEPTHPLLEALLSGSD